MKFSRTWIASCTNEITTDAARCTRTAGSHFCDVMRNRRQRNRTRGVSAAQIYQSVDAARNSCQKLSGRPRATANTYACTEKVRTIRVHAAKISAHFRRRCMAEIVIGIDQLWRNDTPGLWREERRLLAGVAKGNEGH